MNLAEENDDNYLNGRGAQFNTSNKFLKNSLAKEHPEGIDDWEEPNSKTTFIIGKSKTVVNKVDSPDVGMAYSLNPYQGCEHGCIYCYARNSHEYWGFSAGLDFERKIIVKKDAPELFKKFLEKKGWDATPISLSGNTDCYQPAERKFRLTRQLLEIALQYKQPITMITKNALILRDLDILQDLAKLKLSAVYVSITSLDEKLRLKLEPRTTTAKQRLKIIEELSKVGLPTGVMAAPMIPGLNDHEMPAILKACADNGCKSAGYTVVRLNGVINQIFEDWLRKNFPDRFDKVWHQIQNCHNGNVNDSRFGTRMHGEGNFALMIRNTFKLHCRLNGLNIERTELDQTLFKVPTAQTSLF
ncbi:PA0069 family radical SAM protein [Pedobacter frigiditerrae]|uniref:PA0069 family radical SAM protein n=1 Tax=Pedobacter frigiditerrae TaxID=2530452 RepID=A0A4V2MHK7_9SPHI|nr:PA0069 family radical SAM protein [Pedobacter frigiditerrae]TCC86916.1 PA0069 family radical SAM protein [Pedobacter frigiditerrae]